jgi:hypothetical protein
MKKTNEIAAQISFAAGQREMKSKGGVFGNSAFESDFALFLKGKVKR